MASIYDKASLVLIPSGTKTSKVYSQVPTNGDGDFTFSRSTAATRVNASGNIEKETQNLILQSNSFNTTWSTSNASVTSGQSGYDGSSDAWLLSKSAANGFLFQTHTFVGVQTISIYAKAGTSNWLNINVGGATYGGYFDLLNGVTGSNIGSPISTKITDVGGGWYRCEASGTYSGTTSFRIYVADSNGSTSGTSGSVYIQDAQLEQGLVARDYIETTTTAIYGGITDNVPRLDYQGSCPALLLEPQRTNLALTSEYAGGSGWFISSGYSVSHNAAISPEGLQNAFELTIPAVNGNTRAIINVTPSTEYTFSFYVKRGTATELKYSIFNLTNNSNIIAQTSYYSQTSATEWKRIEVTFTTPAGCTSAGVYIDRDSQGDGTAFFYGIQCEQGSYATSYIPTYGSAVTRNVDTARLNNSSALPTSYPLTMYVESDVIGGVSGDLLSFLESGSAANYKVINYNGSQFGSNLRDDGTDNKITGSNTHSTGTYKLAVVVTESSQKLYVNGVLEATGTSIPPFDTDINDMLIGQLRVSSDINRRNTTKQVLVFPTALTDQEAIDLTTL